MLVGRFASFEEPLPQPYRPGVPPFTGFGRPETNWKSAPNQPGALSRVLTWLSTPDSSLPRFRLVFEVLLPQQEGFTFLVDAVHRSVTVVVERTTAFHALGRGVVQLRRERELLHNTIKGYGLVAGVSLVHTITGICSLSLSASTCRISPLRHEFQALTKIPRSMIELTGRFGCNRVR